MNLYGPDRRRAVYICGGDRRRHRRAKCTFCSNEHDWLCDGAGCDVPVCSQHAASVRPLDKDFCPKCMAQPVLGCIGAQYVAEVLCAGPQAETARGGEPVCVAHSLCFTAYLRTGGYESTWRDATRPVEEQRQAMRTWVLANLEQLQPHLKRLATRR